MATTSLKNVHKIYSGSDHYAVKDFNLDIKDREFIVFVGPSGCGKSTTLRMIAGLEDISEGELTIDGEIMNDVQPKDRDIAMVFQNYALYPHMTVADNMSFALKLKKMPKEEMKEQVQRSAEILGLEDLLDRKPAALSGGQRQRVALGRAIVRDPKLFLMDEPLSNLDAKLRVKMRAELSELHKRLKTTTIYVTHDQTEAMTLATRIVVMDQGVIQQIGTPSEVYSKPNNIFVAGFMGSPAMNLFNVHYKNGKLSSENVNIPVTQENEELLNKKGYNGQELVFGIRPEDVGVTASSSERTVSAKVTLAELTGAETILYLELDGVEFEAKVDPRNEYEIGDEVEVTFDMEAAHFFDPETELAIRE